jgi:hypothetical protein
MWWVKVRAGLVSIAVIATVGVLTTLIEGAVATPAEPDEKNSVQQLANEIQKRDAIIQQLIRRVDTLGEQIGDRRSSSAGGSASEHTELAALEPEQAAEASPRRVIPGTSPPDQRSGRPAPGQFDVSDGDAERALERTLIATGNLLVPAGFAEIEPSFNYARREIPTMVLFNLNRNEFVSALTARVGLPLETQLEASLPYNIAEQEITNAFTSPAQKVSARWGNSVGDVTLGVAKTFVHESGWIPDLLGRITYEIPSGPQNDNEVPLPSHFHNLAFSTTALKRQDPLVFVATAGYAKAFQMGQIEPGNQIKFQVGAFLGTSPETTLRSVLQQNFLDDTKIRDTRVPGSGGVQSVLNFGGSSILYRNVLLDLQVGVGLTNLAPKYSVILSSTYRFGVPGL